MAVQLIYYDYEKKSFICTYLVNLNAFYILDILFLIISPGTENKKHPHIK